MPFWLDVFATNNIDVRIIMPTRHPLEVARSLRTRDQFPISLGLLLWLRYVLDAEHATRGALRSIVLWDDFLSNWRRETARISEEIGLPLGTNFDDAGAEIDVFLSPELKREQVLSGDTNVDFELHEWVSEAFEALQQLSTGRNDVAAAQQRLDDVRARFNVAERLLGRSMTILDGELDNLRHERVAWEKEALHIAEVLETERQAALDLLEREKQAAANLLTQEKRSALALLENERRSVVEVKNQLVALRVESEAQHRSLASELSDAKLAQEAKDARMTSLEAELNATLEALTKVVSSRSWRLTAPLRAGLSALLKGRSLTLLPRQQALKIILRRGADLYNRKLPLRWRRVVPRSFRSGMKQWLGRAENQHQLSELPFIAGALPKKSGRKAVFVTHDANIGGAPAVLASIAAWFQNHTDYDVRIVSMCGGPKLSRFQSIAPTFVVGSFEVSPANRPHIRNALEAFIGGDPAFVFVNSVAAGGYCAIDPYKAPVFGYIHELSKILEMFPDQFGDLMTRATHVFCDGPAVFDTIVETRMVTAERLSSRPSFIDLPNETAFLSAAAKANARQRLGWSPGEKIVLACGVVHWRKQPEVFVRAAAELARNGHRKVRFVWIGDGEGLEDAKGLAKKLGVEKIVEFIGHRDDFRPFFQAADVFALTSVEDPFPLVCLEAAAASMPMVIFREAGGMSAMVEPPGEDLAGFAVPLGDERAFSEALSKLLLDDELREAFGRTALTRLKDRFATSAACSEILMTIRKLANLPPRVSIVVPSYNCGPYLDQRLASIAAQSFKDIEILLLDDCSQDDSREKLAEFASTHPEARLQFASANSGSAFKAWKRGIDLAEGELIWLAEADDWCEPDFLERLLPAFLVSGVRLAHGRSIPTNRQGEVAGDYNDLYLKRIAPDRWTTSYTAPAAQEMRLGLGRANSIPNASAVIVTKAAAVRAAEIAESFKLAGDWAFYVSAAFGGRISYVHEAMNYHRRHDQTVTNSIEGSEVYFQELADVGALVRHMYGLHVERDMAFAEFLEAEANRFGFAQELPKGRLPAGTPPKTLNILYGVGDLSGGGAQMFGVRFVNAWARRQGSAVLFKAGHEPDHPALRDLLRPDVPVVDAGDIADRGITAFMEDWGLDLIVTGHWWADRAVGCWMDASSTPWPWVIIMHGCYENVLAAKGCFPDYIQELKRAENHCAHWIWTAPKNKTVFEEGYINPRSASQIINGFEPVEPSGLGRHEFGLPQDAIVFTLASRAIEEKGWNIAVAAFQSIRLRFKGKHDVRLQLIGQGPVMDDLRSRSELEAIHLIPHTGRLVDYIQASDVCLLPSWFAGESLPLVLIEFLAQGKPAIVSDIGMCSWAIDADGSPAGVVVKRDDPSGRVTFEALEQAMIRLIEDSGLRSRASINALQAFQKFDFQTMIANYDAVFAQVMDELGHRSARASYSTHDPARDAEESEIAN